MVSLSETPDGFGGLAAPVETVVSTESAAIMSTGGTEIWQAGKITGTADYKITMWFNSSVTLKHIIKLGTRVFEIMHIDNVDMKNEQMVLYCNERL